MPVSASLRALLAGVIDYAGLFPPATLPLDEAVRNYARYRREPEGWMLGRLVQRMLVVSWVRTRGRPFHRVTAYLAMSAGALLLVAAWTPPRASFRPVPKLPPPAPPRPHRPSARTGRARRSAPDARLRADRPRPSAACDS